MKDFVCSECGYKGQLYYRKKTETFRCSKCNSEFKSDELEDHGS